MALLTAGLSAGSPANASAPRWTIQPTPNQPGNNSQLEGVACSSAKACIAVGLIPKLVEVWNGSRWTIQPTPTPTGATGSQLYGIACPSSTACTAIGSYTDSAYQGLPLVEHWNGSHWTIQPVPNQPSGELTAIDCPSPTECTAVGSADNKAGRQIPFVEARNGSHWTIQPTPTLPGGGQFTAVACPTRTACTAVGFAYNKADTQQYLLAETWNGSRWRVQPTAPAGWDPESVQCGGLPVGVRVHRRRRDLLRSHEPPYLADRGLERIALDDPANPHPGRSRQHRPEGCGLCFGDRVHCRRVLLDQRAIRHVPDRGPSLERIPLDDPAHPQPARCRCGEQFQCCLLPVPDGLHRRRSRPIRQHLGVPCRVPPRMTKNTRHRGPITPG